MLACITSGANLGIQSYLVRVEVCISDGMPCFDMVGFLAAEVKEARERVRIALQNMGILLPPKRITVNLSPADKRKDGTSFDLPIALGILCALGIMDQENMEKTICIGELGLDGKVLFSKGVLPILLMAKENGYQSCILSQMNYREASYVKGITLLPLNQLEEALTLLTKEEPFNQRNKIRLIPKQTKSVGRIKCVEETYRPNLNEVHGQPLAKRAVEIAAARFHNVLLIGPPGSGKTMIAQRIPSILPPLSEEESLEVSQIYSVSGLLGDDNPLIQKRPFLNPHHTISEQALAGGGRIPKPGVISLAHRGVMFLDEFTEFRKSTLEIMRQPLEDKVIHIARNYGTFVYPADFMLVAAMNKATQSLIQWMSSKGLKIRLFWNFKVELFAIYPLKRNTGAFPIRENEYPFNDNQ